MERKDILAVLTKAKGDLANATGSFLYDKGRLRTKADALFHRVTWVETRLGDAIRVLESEAFKPSPHPEGEQDG